MHPRPLRLRCRSGNEGGRSQPDGVRGRSCARAAPSGAVGAAAPLSKKLLTSTSCRCIIVYADEGRAILTLHPVCLSEVARDCASGNLPARERPTVKRPTAIVLWVFSLSARFVLQRPPRRAAGALRAGDAARRLRNIFFTDGFAVSLYYLIYGTVCHHGDSFKCPIFPSFGERYNTQSTGKICPESRRFKTAFVRPAIQPAYVS